MCSKIAGADRLIVATSHYCSSLLQLIISRQRIVIAPYAKAATIKTVVHAALVVVAALQLFQSVLLSSFPAAAAAKQVQ